MVTDRKSTKNQNLISSIRAAQLSGYSQDYVGQLCRTGSIECNRVMGEWRVDLESLLAYKKRFNPNFSPDTKDLLAAKDTSLTPTTQGHKDIFTKDGKEYVSSLNASELTGYSQDYIGQLARSNAIPAQKLGRKWFVSKKDLLEHKEHNDALLVTIQKKALGVSPSTQVHNNHATTIKKSQVNKIKINKLQSVTYKRDDGVTISGIVTSKDLEDKNKQSNQMHVNTMDLRDINKRYVLKNKVQSPVSGMGEDIEAELKTKHRHFIIKLNFVHIIVGLEISIILTALFYPDILYNMAADFASNNSIFAHILNFLQDSVFLDIVIKITSF